VSEETTVKHGSAEAQAELWGERARDWAQIAEQAARPWLGPAYELVLERLEVGASRELLDVGCGAGRFLRMACDRGAKVTGIDATAELLAIARERVPEADLRQGDLQFLPFDDAAFDIVTGFNSFFYAADVVCAFREARRVLRQGGHVAVTAFGRPEQCESSPLFDYLGPLMPKLAVEEETEPHKPGVIEGLLGQAGLETREAGYIKVTEHHPDVDTVLREWMSVGPVRLAVRTSGERAVQAALAGGLRTLVAPDGSVRITDEYRYVIAKH
jgi:SAM-dependent methyltransferase